MWWTDPTTRNTRKAICLACDSYRPEFGTCGKPLTPAILNETATDADGQEVKLCGCVIKLKVKVAIASCPREFWPRLKVNDERAAEIKSFLEAALADKKKPASKKELAKIYKDLTGFELCPTCPADGENMLRDLKTQIEFI